MPKKAQQNEVKKNAAFSTSKNIHWSVFKYKWNDCCVLSFLLQKKNVKKTHNRK